METIIAVFLGAFLADIGILSYIRICRDFEEVQK